jgi:hypothetical protein
MALGRRGEVGAARIDVSDNDWKQRVAALALQADLIVAIPSDRPGTRWEMAWLVEHRRLSRALFVMPPKTAGVVTEESWNAVRTRLAGIGMYLPEFSSDGLLFVLNDNGHVAASGDWDADPSRLRANVDALMGLMPLQADRKYERP